jgi:F-type H+/Na+-transporting ATPase subunit alpha
MLVNLQHSHSLHQTSTVAKIERGKRLTEMLKQSTNEPRSFAKQAVLVYAGVKGYLDKLPAEKVLSLEKVVNDKLDSSYKSLFDAIIQKKELSADIEEEIKALLIEAVAEVK